MPQNLEKDEDAEAERGPAGGRVRFQKG